MTRVAFTEHLSDSYSATSNQLCGVIIWGLTLLILITFVYVLYRWVVFLAAQEGDIVLQTLSWGCHRGGVSCTRAGGWGGRRVGGTKKRGALGVRIACSSLFLIGFTWRRLFVRIGRFWVFRVGTGNPLLTHGTGFLGFGEPGVHAPTVVG